MEPEREGRDAVEADARRVVTEYKRRSNDDRLRAYYERVGPAMERAARDRRLRLLSVIDTVKPRDAARVLEVGCGRGADLAALVSGGLNERLAAGVDLLPEDIAEARTQLPNARISVANAAELPFESGKFDVVYQVVMLSSVVDPAVRRRIASELRRVLAPGGRIVSYDMTYVGDGNPHLAPIDARELNRLFPDCVVDIARVTLQLPIASRVPARAADVLERVPWLRRHHFAVITPGEG